MKIFLFVCILQAFCVSVNLSKQQLDAKKIDAKKVSKLQTSYISDGNFSQIIKSKLSKNQQNQIVALLFTNKNCQTCQVLQPFLSEIIKQFQNENILIYRCQLADNKKLAQKFEVKRFPIIHFVYKKYDQLSSKGFEIKIYKTTQIISLNIIQLAKYLSNVLKYQSNQSKNKDFPQTLQQIPQINKIIVNHDQISKLLGLPKDQMVQKLILDPIFNTLPIVLLNQELFNMYAIKYNIQAPIVKGKTQKIHIYISLQDQKLDSFTHTAIRNDYLQKLSKQGFQPKFIFQSLLLYTVQQFTQSIYSIHQQLNSLKNIPTPIYLTVLDSIWNVTVSETHIKTLNKLLRTYQNQILIFWTEGQINPEKKILLGFQKKAKPPLFGRLIFNKDQKKQPLNNPKTNQPIFTQSQIKRKIRIDLGYQKKLGEKIANSLNQFGYKNQITVMPSLNQQINSSKISFAYCTSENLRIQTLNNLAFLINRFKRFYPNSNLVILTDPCLISNQQSPSGLHMIFKNKKYLISRSQTECYMVSNTIIDYSQEIANQLGRRKILPKYFCIPEGQMREFLINLKQ